MVTEANSAVGGAEGPTFGKQIMALADRLAQWSDAPDGLTCTYLSEAHRSVAAEIRNWMEQAGLTTGIDAVANVVGRYAAADPRAPTLILASHYDTVRNAGKYDGRLGVLVALVVAEHLTFHRQDRVFGFRGLQTDGVAVLGEHVTGMLTVKQTSAQLGFEHGYAAADSRRRCLEGAGGLGQAADAGNRQEVLEIVPFHRYFEN